jgi:hypothetical protein
LKTAGQSPGEPGLGRGRQERMAERGTTGRGMAGSGMADAAGRGRVVSG